MLLLPVFLMLFQDWNAMFKDEILNSIEDIVKNYKCYLVGGYLRNYFINNEISKDRDITVIENCFEFAQELSKKLSGTLIELDKENQIYRVVLKDKQNFFDIAQALENDIVKDAKRRDFTINSIYYDLNKKELFNPVGGIEDIKNKILKTPQLSNMLDDPLRFLRLYRFCAQTGFSVEDKLCDFVKHNFEKINSIAKERINYEILKMFEGKYIAKTLSKMFDDGTLEMVFPFVKEIKRVPSNSHHHLDLVHHSIETVNQIRIDKPILKLAAFYHDIGKPSTWTIEPIGRHRFIGHDLKGAEIVKKELENLKFSNKQTAYISKMVKYHIYPAGLIQCTDANKKKAFARFIRKLGDDTPDIIELSRADRLSAQGVAVSKEMTELALKHLDSLLKYYNEIKSSGADTKVLLDGKKIMEILNIKPSKTVGIILEQLKEAQIAGEVSSKEEAVDFIKNKAVKR